jgi:uncharacterized protein with HEPN domain
MQHDVRVWLYDMQVAIDEIESFVDIDSLTLDVYSKNTLLRRGIERDLEIIGEAMVRVLRHEPNVSITHARQIVNLRNQIVHGYDDIDDKVILNILKKHLRLLKIELNEVLGDLG